MVGKDECERCAGVRGVVVLEVWWCKRCSGVRGVVV